MAIPTVIREYTPRACRNSRKLRRLPLRRNMRPDSPAFRAEEFRVPNQRYKEPPFPGWNWKQSPRTLSQQGKNTDVISRIQNRLVYPKSTQDEAHFHYIESIAISHSTSYTTSGLTSFTTIQRLPETPSQVYRNITFSKATGWKIRAPHIIWRWELIRCLRLKR